MRYITKFLALVLLSLCLITGCSDQAEKEQALQAARDAASEYSFLNNGRNACNTLTGMLSYYDNYSYQKAKETAKVSDNLRVIYFPSVNWQGTEILSTEVRCEITQLLVSSYSERQIEYLFCINIDDGYYMPSSTWYKATYSVNQDLIIELEEICSL